MSELFNDILKTLSPCGSEDLLREVIEKNAVTFCDKMYKDNLGNLILRKSGNGKRLMLCTNMDEPCLIVSFIDDNGRLFFDVLGSLKEAYLPGKTVKFLNSVKGVIVSPKDSTLIKDMYIDIGCSDKISAESQIKIGDAAVIYTPVTKLSENKIACSGLYGKAGVLVLLEVLKRMTTSNYDTYFVFTVQKNMGNKGVKAAAFNVEPEIGISVSAVPKEKLKGGASIKVRDKSVICQREIVEKLTDIAKTKKIPFTLEVSKTVSEAGEIYKTANGVLTGGVGVPIASADTGNEIICIDDIESVISLLLSLLAG